MRTNGRSDTRMCRSSSEIRTKPLIILNFLTREVDQREPKGDLITNPTTTPVMSDFPGLDRPRSRFLTVSLRIPRVKVTAESYRTETNIHKIEKCFTPSLVEMTSCVPLLMLLATNREAEVDHSSSNLL